MGHLSHENTQKLSLNSEQKEVRFGGQPGEKWVPIDKPWRFEVDNPKCIAFHGLDGMDMEVWRISGPCGEFRKHADGVPCPLEDGCPYLFVKPGRYEVRQANGSDEMPDTFYPECMSISVDKARLMIELGNYNYRSVGQ